MRMIDRMLAAAVFSLTAMVHAAAQSPPAAPTERPGDLYKELNEPLEQVRSSLENWSPAEQAALAAAIRRAQQYCTQVQPVAVSGDDLYQLARICTVGLQWNAAQAAAAAYIRSAAMPDLPAAYAVSVNALMNLKDLRGAIDAARSMLRAVPYGAVADHSLNNLIDFLAMSVQPDALELARARQPGLLVLLAAGAAQPPQMGQTVGTAALYGEGLELAFLERYAGQEAEAAQTVAALDAALANVAPAQVDDAVEIARARLRYGLLGRKLPPLTILPYRMPGGPRADIDPNYRGDRVFLLFPAWCAQCRRMMPSVAGIMARHGAEGIRAYGLLALDAEAAKHNPFSGEEGKDLLHTPTLATPESTLEEVGAAQFPFVILADDADVVRYIGTVATNAFDPGAFVEQFMARMNGLAGSAARDH